MSFPIACAVLAGLIGWHAGAWHQERRHRRTERLLAAHLYRFTLLLRDPAVRGEVARDETRRQMARWN